MLSNDIITKEAADYKKDAKKNYDEAVVALLILAWPYRKENFNFEQETPVYNEALSICMSMSDKCAEAAQKRLFDIIAEIEDADGDAVWEYVYNADYEARFDMAGSHLLELLAVWIGVAAANGWTRDYTRVMISRFIENPFLCQQWRDFPLNTLAWGSGYSRNIAEQIALIGQGIIIGGSRYAEWMHEKEKGATYYVRRRGSNYPCDWCEEYANIPIPIDVPFEPFHARCVCFPEYFYDEMPTP